MATKVKLIETGAVTGNIIPDGGIATAKLADDAVTTIKISDGNITHEKLHTSMDLTGKTVTVATAAGSTNTTAAASTAFVQQELTTLIGGAPSTLDTLNELAAAINDDASYASTLTTALATKLPLAGGTMTGALTSNSLIKTTGDLEIASTQPRLILDRADGSYSWNIYNGGGTDFPLSSFNIANNAGTAVITALDSGNVGIGTDSPTMPLSVKAASNAYAINMHGRSDGYSELYGSSSDGSTKYSFLQSHSAQTKLYTLVNTPLLFGTNSTERMRLSEGGTLHLGSGHGTASASNGVLAAAYASGYNNAGGNLEFYGGRSTGDNPGGEIQFFTGAAGSPGTQINSHTRRMTIDADGNVGIGTDSPAQPLHIKSNGAVSYNGATDLDGESFLTLEGTSADGEAAMIRWANHGGMNNYFGVTQVGSNGQGDFVWTSYNGSAYAERMRLDKNGNVGIGNTDPNLPLTVTSNSGANAIAIRARSGDDYAFLQFYNNAGDTLRGEVYSHSTGNAIGISSGNSSSNGIKIDGDGLHFQKTDGQSITAKESIVMTVDVDNNTASRVFQVNHGNGKTLLNLYDDYRTDVGTLQYNALRSAGAGGTSSFSASAGDWVDVAAIPYGRNVATIKFFWDGLSAPGSAHHGLMEFDIGSHYGTSYYYGWDSYINLKTSSAHNSFYISEARIITPNGAGATGYFQVKFAVGVSTGTFRSYVTARDEACSIDPVNPVVNNSRSGTTIAHLKLGTDQGLVTNRVGMATSRDMHIGGGLTIVGQTSFNAFSPAVTSTNNTVVFGSARHNVGGGYSTSTGKFTASTAGKYFFTFDILMDSTANANYGRVLFRVNDTGGTMEQYGDSLTYQASGQSYFGLGLTCLISLQVGDTVEVFNSGQWPTYGTQYGVFCGHLLG
jgi:hypothetical protein